MQNKSFRADINGLRAFAVLSVIIFHFNKNYLPGGFVGVDIFFVISGYLMTSIIFRGLSDNTFSYLKFLISRAKRIIPALTILILSLLFIGYFLLEPMTYQMLGKHSTSSLIFISNFIYNSESGYFDVSNKNKILLHTWSLSVEWQFYLLYPIVISLLKKIFNLKKINIVLLVFFILSLLSSLLVTNSNPSSSYFMLYSRAWEMILGGLAFIYPLKNIKTNTKIIIAWLGFSLILVSFFIVNENTPWPGYMALVPTLGSYLIIQANTQFLSQKPIQFIGKISYSAYLTHWPILILSYKLYIDLDLASYLIIVLLTSISLYYLVERKRNYSYIMAVVFLVTLVLSFYISKDGANYRVDDKYKLSASEFHENYYGGKDIPQSAEIEIFNANKFPEKIIITGDSLARQYMNSLKEEHLEITSILLDGCFSSKNFHTNSHGDLHTSLCKKRYDNFLLAMKSDKNSDIIISQNWGDYNPINHKSNKNEKSIDILESEINEMINDGGSHRNYFIVGISPGSAGFSYFECEAKYKLPLLSMLQRTGCQKTSNEQINVVNNKLFEIAQKHKNVFFINPHDALCKNGICILSDKNGDPIYSDDIHLSVFGSPIVTKHIINIIKKTHKE
ncbi:acyltransferase family protein [Morganella morganii]|uniref:acyltransferase family protein n=1 Tax=Morganella morganii TaxID=582 RepID=UPI0032DB2A57